MYRPNTSPPDFLSTHQVGSLCRIKAPLPRLESHGFLAWEHSHALVLMLLLGFCVLAPTLGLAGSPLLLWGPCSGGVASACPAEFPSAQLLARISLRCNCRLSFEQKYIDLHSDSLSAIFFFSPSMVLSLNPSWGVEFELLFFQSIPLPKVHCRQVFYLC